MKGETEGEPNQNECRQEKESALRAGNAGHAGVSVYALLELRRGNVAVHPGLYLVP